MQRRRRGWIYSPWKQTLKNPEKVNKILKNPEMKRKIPDDICIQRRGRVLADRIMGARFRALKQTLTPLNLLQRLCIFSIARFFLFSLNENNDIIVLCMRMGIGTAERSQLFMKELLVSHKPSWYSMISTCYKAFVFSQWPFFYIH